MEFLGVGPLELIFILLIALIILGPNDMVKAGRTIGRTLRRIVMSPTWQTVRRTSQELRVLPNKLMREAGMEEEVKDFQQIGDEVNRLKEPFRNAQETLEEETQTIQSGLSAWITPLGDEIKRQPPEPKPPMVSAPGGSPVQSEPPTETARENETTTTDPGQKNPDETENQ
jgi:Sec-independent protein translocase protein TatA